MKKIIITLGDYNGIGPKCVEGALNKLNSKRTKFYLVGDKSIFKRLKFKSSLNIEILERNNKVIFNPGKASVYSGRASIDYLNYALDFMKKNDIHSLVTMPISKEAISKAGSKFKGHTDMLQKKFNVDEVVMAFWSNKIKVTLSTIHVPLSKVLNNINTEKLIKQIKIINENFTKILNRKPSIALCSINPHASENGTLGSEDLDITIPAYKKLKKIGVNISAPYPSDTLFSKKNIDKYDIFHAIYHDQGLIPFKMLSFDTGVNFTLNLPIIRTSPDHGTAYDIAWRKEPSYLSTQEAIKLAQKL